MNSKLFGKLKAGEQRLFRKADEGAHKILGKMKSQVFDNPRFIHYLKFNYSEPFINYDQFIHCFISFIFNFYFSFSFICYLMNQTLIFHL